MKARRARRGEEVEQARDRREGQERLFGEQSGGRARNSRRGWRKYL
jgi:hypothetical protein